MDIKELAKEIKTLDKIKIGDTEIKIGDMTYYVYGKDIDEDKVFGICEYKKSVLILTENDGALDIKDFNKIWFVDKEKAESKSKN